LHGWRWAPAQLHGDKLTKHAPKNHFWLMLFVPWSAGDSSSEGFPRLAGQHSEYIAKQLSNFKSGARKSTAMRDMVAKLTTM
jgi:hypothetical protein